MTEQQAPEPVPVLPELVQRYVAQEQLTNPKLKIVRKKDSKLMLAIGWLFRVTGISPQFNDGYYTTIGSTVHVPEQAYTSDSTRLLEVIMHECLHAADDKKWPGIFPVTYLAPQIFAVLALLAALAPVTSLWMLLWLCALVFLAPLPAYGRYRWELRAYRTSVLFARKVHGYSETDMAGLYTWASDQLSKKYYYFTWPFPKSIEKDFKDESFMTQPEYVRMTDFLKKENLLLPPVNP